MPGHEHRNSRDELRQYDPILSEEANRKFSRGAIWTAAFVAAGLAVLMGLGMTYHTEQPQTPGQSRIFEFG